MSELLKVYDEWAKFGAEQRLEFQKFWRENHEIIQKAKKNTCEHQFFEVKQLSDNSCDCSENKDFHVHLPYRFGVRVMCALCNEKRDLWDEDTPPNRQRRTNEPT